MHSYFRHGIWKQEPKKRMLLQASFKISPAETNRLRNHNQEKSPGQLLVTNHNLPSKEYHGMPRGHSSIYARFSSKRTTKRTSMYIPRQRAIAKQGKTIFLSYYNLYLRKLKEKLARKARVNTDASISDRAHAPWASHNTPQIELNSIWPPYR